MSRLNLITMVFASAFMMTSCEESKNRLQIELLENNWTQAFEEKLSDDLEVYRPSDYKDFPVARYRQVFNFHENKVCEYLVLAENDGHYMETGTWEYDPKTNRIKILNSETEIVHDFEVVQLSEDLLKLEPAK